MTRNPADAALASPKVVEAKMRIEGYEYQSDFARGHFAKGKADMLRIVCIATGIEWNEARAGHVATLDDAGLLALVEHITRERRWPG